MDGTQKIILVNFEGVKNMREMETRELLRRLENELEFCYNTSLKCLKVLGKSRTLKDYISAVQNEYERIETTIDMLLCIDAIGEYDYLFMQRRLHTKAESYLIELSIKYAEIK